MRIGIIGAGAVGGAFAALLAGSASASGGHTVEVTARGAHLDAIREGGIRLRGGFGSIDARVAASETLTSTPDLAIVTTKAQDAAAAITANLASLRGIPLLVVQNGLDGVATATRLSPSSHVVGGLAMFAASFLTPGEVTITAPGPTFIGGEGAGDIAALLDPPVDLSVIDNFEGAQWSKLVVNQINALPAITGLSAQEVIADRGLRRLMTASIRENIRIGIANGITFEDLHGLTDRRLRIVARLPLALGETLPRQFARRMGSVPNPGSTQQSIRRGQPSEIDYLNGAVVTAAKAVGLEAPVNAALVELVHEVELSYVFISPAEVLRRVALLTGETA